MRSTTEAERGFTLVELSIVLVLVGLLIGGILKGQELIQDTKIKAVQKDFDVIRAATLAFTDRFGRLPGDGLSGAGATPTVGTSNAQIDFAGCADWLYKCSENRWFWEELNTQGFYSVGPPPPTGTFILPRQGYPEASIGGGYAINTGTNQNNTSLATFFANGPRNWIVLGKAVGTSAYFDTGALNIEQLMLLERKYDDGNNVDGQIRARLPGGNVDSCNYGTLNTGQLSYCLVYSPLYF